ncbi:hypothetical protein AHF37_07131 [Paragonimus kellicotti]|nr:hypothetical protein AHF37_07131 [Paragonimus kellicotti]
MTTESAFEELKNLAVTDDPADVKVNQEDSTGIMINRLVVNTGVKKLNTRPGAAHSAEMRKDFPTRSDASWVASPHKPIHAYQASSCLNRTLRDKVVEQAIPQDASSIESAYTSHHTHTNLDG